MKETIHCIDCLTEKSIEIVLENNTIVSKTALEQTPEGTLYLGPGFNDLQINGFAGVDFNTYPILESDFLTAIKALIKEGVTSFLPTVITNSDKKIISLLENINSLCNKNKIIESYIKGIHLEGPFISPEEGAKGAHDKQFIKAPDWELFQQFQQASGNRIKIVTISPEWDNTAEFIKKCIKNNVIVSLGHTVASPAHIRTAIEAGASMSTHLGNGAPLSLPRNSNFIFEQLASDALTVSLIADGFHLPDSFLKIALKTKQNNAILVSDSTMFAGMKPGIYDAHIGGKVQLEANGRLSPLSNPNILAGAAISLLDCVKKLVKSELTSLSHAWKMASILPNNLLGIKKDSISKNTNGDCTLFRVLNKEIQIVQVYKNNKCVFSEQQESILQ